MGPFANILPPKTAHILCAAVGLAFFRRPYFRRWTRNGLWLKINAVLLARVRLEAGRQAQPSLIIIDSQSVKKAQKGGLNKVLTGTSESKVESGT